ncbi:hypothetical protein CGRA01v4_06315 [Colletotrichum graminicola]|nr:hypothetical protein CGRA01v4_06315 [Colletotrichum graminicola]
MGSSPMPVAGLLYMSPPPPPPLLSPLPSALPLKIVTAIGAAC